MTSGSLDVAWHSSRANSSPSRRVIMIRRSVSWIQRGSGRNFLSHFEVDSGPLPVAGHTQNNRHPSPFSKEVDGLFHCIDRYADPVDELPESNIDRLVSSFVEDESEKAPGGDVQTSSLHFLRVPRGYEPQFWRRQKVRQFGRKFDLFPVQLGANVIKQPKRLRRFDARCRRFGRDRFVDLSLTSSAPVPRPAAQLVPVADDRRDVVGRQVDREVSTAAAARADDPSSLVAHERCLHVRWRRGARSRRRRRTPRTFRRGACGAC